MAPIIKEVVKLLRSSLPATIDIRCLIGGATAAVTADPTHIYQVLMNLGTNAAHAMRKKGGILEVHLSEVISDRDPVPCLDGDLVPGRYVRLSVRDTGPGIPPSVMGRIFDPFFTTKAPGEGTGMGLSVVHGIMKSYGGGIQVESKPGEGTTFHVFFPLADRQDTSAVEPQASFPAGKGHVLVVDDEKSIVDSVGHMLRYLGYEVRMSTSSLEALEAFRTSPDEFDLVILDQTMPHMTGVELAQAFMGVRSDIPIILCTGFSEMTDANRAKDLGIREFVTKPIVMEDMAKTVRKVMEQAV
ncbi:MAG: response regulator [Deltaproteobacteria bacterium]|nr:response regulator [Deltaproteobacteria bacterium]